MSRPPPWLPHSPQHGCPDPWGLPPLHSVMTLARTRKLKLAEQEPVSQFSQWLGDPELKLWPMALFPLCCRTTVPLPFMGALEDMYHQHAQMPMPSFSGGFLCSLPSLLRVLTVVGPCVVVIHGVDTDIHLHLGSILHRLTSFRLRTDLPTGSVWMLVPVPPSRCSLGFLPV